MFRVALTRRSNNLHYANNKQFRSVNYSKSASKQFNVGFIGLGQMGLRMAKNLVKAGKTLVVYDLEPEPVEQLKISGAQVAHNPKELAEASQMVITMLPSSPQVNSVYLENEHSIIHGLSKDQLCIDCSTIDPNVARSVAQKVKDLGAVMVDAPVSGGIVGAQNATLTFMVGGSEEGFTRAKSLLQLMGKNVIHCGGSGNGQLGKLCNNLVLGISMIGVSEAMNLGIQLGMDPKVLAGVINTSSGRCWSSDSYNPVPGVTANVPSSNNYKGGFAVNLMAKDLGLVVSAARASSKALPLGQNAWEIYNTLSKEGYGTLDFSSVYKYLQDKS